VRTARRRIHAVSFFGDDATGRPKAFCGAHNMPKHYRGKVKPDIDLARHGDGLDSVLGANVDGQPVREGLVVGGAAYAMAHEAAKGHEVKRSRQRQDAACAYVAVDAQAHALCKRGKRRRAAAKGRWDEAKTETTKRQTTQRSQ